MKLTCTLIIVLFSFVCFAQAPPDAFNYSGAARDAQGNPISEKTIGVELSILKASPTGAVQYRERHFVNTDKFGVFNCSVGQGSVQQGTFSAVNWSNDSYYLRVGLDANGGTNFVVLGTTQLLSVPYALYAKSSTPTAINAGTNVTVTGQGTTASPYVINANGGGGGGFTRYIGEQFGGGVIFHLWKDAQGVEHGLIVATTDQSTGTVWSNITTTLVGSSAQSSWNGLANSNAIVSQAGHTSSAAKLCLDLVSGGQSDWYLPSIDELNLLYNNRFNVNKTLSSIAGATVLPFSADYWGSTEYSADDAWTFFLDGRANGGNKDRTYYVRAVRAF